MSDVTRAILLTSPGAAAIAVVRLVGPRAGEFLAMHFSKPAPENRCVHGILRDGDRELDDPVVVVSHNARVVDLNLHGGAWVVQSVLETARREGFEIHVDSRVVPEWAVDADDPIERDVLAYLPLARTELAIRALLAQPKAWREHRELLDPNDRSLWWLLHPPRVAIVGAPNVGKSTLANQLFAQERSITADLPGTTRDWVGEIANIDGLAVMLVDTPGVRETSDAIEREAIDRSREEVRRADLVVLVLDASMPLEPQQRLIDAHRDAIRVINKSDRDAVWSGEGIKTVATKGVGVDELRKAILKHFGVWNYDLNRPRRWQSPSPGLSPEYSGEE